MSEVTNAHRHGLRRHAHPYAAAHRHFRFGLRKSVPDHAPAPTARARARARARALPRSRRSFHRSVTRGRQGRRAQPRDPRSDGVRAARDLHAHKLGRTLRRPRANFGDALTAVPLGIAFYLRSFRAEKLAGLAVVLAIFVSACVALYETIQRFIHPEDLTHLWVLAAAGVIGFVGNELAAQVRLRAGRRLSSPALVADGNHARTDGFVSLGVVASAILVAVGLPRADPVVGLLITLVIFKITWDSWRLISTTDPGEMVDHEHQHDHHHEHDH